MRHSLALLSLAFALAGMVPLAFAADEQGAEPSLQGFWFSTGGGRLSRTVLLIQDDRFVVIDATGSYESTFTADPAATLPEIDLARYDGADQQGVYRIDGDTLHLTLADPNQHRPEGASVEKAAGVPHYHYVFVRKPTAEGLKSLQKHFQ